MRNVLIDDLVCITANGDQCVLEGFDWICFCHIYVCMTLSNKFHPEDGL